MTLGRNVVPSPRRYVHSGSEIVPEASEQKDPHTPAMRSEGAALFELCVRDRCGSDRRHYLPGLHEWLIFSPPVGSGRTWFWPPSRA